jgi:hypothetical protein
MYKVKELFGFVLFNWKHTVLSPAGSALFFGFTQVGIIAVIAQLQQVSSRIIRFKSCHCNRSSLGLKFVKK